MPCPYANLLGVPGEGVHKPRIFGFALVDILLTIVAALITTFIFKIDIWLSLLGWFVLGEVLHYVFGTQTAFIKMLGLNPPCAASTTPYK
jgi:hypothetical protein